MLFGELGIVLNDKQMNEQVFESYKERNLYYKFFAGYFANELIHGWETRFKSLVDLINAKYEPLGKKLIMSPRTTHLSFDNYIVQYLKGATCDRGEFADVYFYDQATKSGVAIEVKYLSKIKAKDVVDNSRRWHKIESGILPLFLISENAPSFPGDIQAIRKTGVPFITWQELLKRTGPRTKNVKTYIASMLRRNSRSDWMI
jgi:hypothetical protein